MQERKPRRTILFLFASFYLHRLPSSPTYFRLVPPHRERGGPRPRCFARACPSKKFAPHVVSDKLAGIAGRSFSPKRSLERGGTFLPGSRQLQGEKAQKRVSSPKKKNKEKKKKGNENTVNLCAPLPLAHSPATLILTRRRGRERRRRNEPRSPPFTWGCGGDTAQRALMSVLIYFRKLFIFAL